MNRRNEAEFTEAAAVAQTTAARRRIGDSMERVEDPAILTGRGRMGMTWGANRGRCLQPLCARRTRMPK